jgi:hypothetical protein
MRYRSFCEWVICWRGIKPTARYVGHILFCQWAICLICGVTYCPICEKHRCR